MNRLLPLLLLGLGLSVALASPMDKPLGVSPHGKPDQCLACHAPPPAGAPSGTKVGAPLPIVENCRSCHPTADMHPVHVTPSRTKPPADFPLENGQVVCATCHTEPSHEWFNKALPPPWFRDGPYERITDLCVQCHAPTVYKRVEPHQGRTGNMGSCAACHIGPVTPGADQAGWRLRTKPEAACVVCHEGTVHAGTAAHLGKEVPAEVAAKLPPTMALVDGKIACFTCHEVHDGQHSGSVDAPLPQVLRSTAQEHGWAPVPADTIWPGQDTGTALLALPLQGSELCAACHGKGGR